MREDWSLGSLPAEGRACEESLGSSHISQKMKKWKDSQLVPKKGISLAWGDWPLLNSKAPSRARVCEAGTLLTPCLDAFALC